MVCCLELLVSGQGQIYISKGSHSDVSLRVCVCEYGGGNLTTCDSWLANANEEGWSREGNDCCHGNAELEWLMVG